MTTADDRHPWRKAKVPQDTPPEQAIETALNRLADLFEALNGVRPERPDEPAHVTLVRWTPILADYGMFAQRANEAEARRRAAEEQRDEKVGAARKEASKANIERAAAVHTLKRIEQHMRYALTVLDAEVGVAVDGKPETTPTGDPA
jgi:hypothetical protein